MIQDGILFIPSSKITSFNVVQPANAPFGYDQESYPLSVTFLGIVILVIPVPFIKQYPNDVTLSGNVRLVRLLHPSNA